MKRISVFLSILSLLFPVATFAAATDVTASISLNAGPEGQCLFKGSGSAVYAPMPDGSRRVFPNQRTWASWYANDISCIQPVTDAALADMPLTGMVTMRPGTSLVKVVSDPRVYAVEAPNVLRWIASEETAKALYGETWNKHVTDIDETLMASYVFGAPIVVASNFDVSKASIATRPWDVSSEDMPRLRIISRNASNLAELELTVPTHATLPTSVVDISVREEDRVALALCEIDCSITIQLNRPGIFQAMNWMGDIMHVSNKIALDPTIESTLTAK